MRAMLAAVVLISGCGSGGGPAPAANDAMPAVAANAAAPATRPQAARPAHPCLTQDGKPLDVAPVRAIGTEPFWGARTQGRCVTYSTPDDQAGTRVWARVDSGPVGSKWMGALRGKRFELSVTPMPGCSDGMSDNRYPLEAKLLVDGEERRGCAEPLATGR